MGFSSAGAWTSGGCGIDQGARPFSSAGGALIRDRLARLPAWIVAPLAIAGALVLAAAFVVATGNDLSAATASLFRGAFGSRYAFLSATLVRSVPLILTGLAVAWAFTGGVFNIGVEGQFLVGACAATAVGLALPGGGMLTLVLMLCAGAVTGAAWAGIAAWLRIRFAVLEVISTIMLNFIALQLLAYLVHGPLGDPNGIYPQSPSLPASTWMPIVATGTRLHAGFLLALGACAIGWFIRNHTAAGFRLRLAGVNPRAAEVAGRVDVARTMATAFLASGAIAGVAGAVEVSGVTYALYESISPGYGYTAIAVALLANLNPGGVIISGIGFGALEAGAASMQRDANIPSVIVSVIEATIILVLAMARLQSRPDAATEAPR